MGNPSSCPVIGDAPSCQCSQAGPRCFMGKHEHDASTGLRLLWCRSGGFIRKPEHDARGCTRGWMYSFPPIPLLNCTITRVVASLSQAVQLLSTHRTKTTDSRTRRGTNAMFGDLIAMEGTNANEPCRIGSIRPRRQARERRSLQPSKSQVPSGKTMVSVLQMCLPLKRNQLLTTSN